MASIMLSLLTTMLSMTNIFCVFGSISSKSAFAWADMAGFAAVVFALGLAAFLFCAPAAAVPIWASSRNISYLMFIFMVFCISRFYCLFSYSLRMRL